jgi:FAD/FMN-containing dehydrogenase
MTAVQATTAAGGAAVLDEETIQGFKEGLGGELLRPGDDGYDGARRIWNGMIDRRPALIARCTGTADVIEAVRFARENGLLLSVRGGGHNIAGHAVCDGGLMIDLSLMKGIWVDPASRTARAQPGVTLGELDRETQVHGLAAVLGFISTTGIAGLTIGGGFGYLSRKRGWTTDNLLSVEMITSDGQLLRASADENGDLFWAVRGGGGNFGVVTSFEYRLHPVGPRVLAGLILHPLEDVDEVFSFYRSYAAQAPEELTTFMFFRLAPPAPFVPKEWHGKPVIGIGACHTGSVKRAREDLAPLKEFGNPIADAIVEKTYCQQQSMLDATQPPGRHYYWKSEYLPRIEEEMVGTIVEHVRHITSPHSAVFLFHLGGAIGRHREDETATGNRDVEFVLNVMASWEPGAAEAHVGWARALWQRLRQYSTGGVYVNFLTEEEGAERLKAAYRGTSYARLARLKAIYDPDNLFRVNQNIRPAITAAQAAVPEPGTGLAQ